MLEIEIVPRPLETLRGVLTREQSDRFRAAAARAAEALSGRTVWNVSSTATGGGVAEMLHTLLGYVAGAGVRSRWLVLAGDADFFAATKRLHNAIHGLGSVPAVTAADRSAYDSVLARNLPGLLGQLRPEDLVLLHDPQTAGLVGPVRAAGVPVVWRSHIGLDTPVATSISAWEFLRGYLEAADDLVFSRRQYAPPWVPTDRLWVISPSIDPLSAKNRPIASEECVRILTGAGLLAGGQPVGEVVQGAPPPAADAPLVVQVSRWDRLKDMPGVMLGFARMSSRQADAHLMLVGPAVAGVTDDPEGAQVFAECLDAWQRLPAGVRERVHLASVPTDDPERNATIVNAIQRHAAVVVQKSIAEGFGLTVTEAMWKGRPVIASGVGGILDQISDGRDGLLIADPHDLDAFAAAVERVLSDGQLARRLGEAAHLRVRDQYLGDRHLGQYAELFETVLSRASSRPTP
jgi:trehalose synthase